MPDWLTLDDLHRLRPDVARTTIWRWVRRWAADGVVRVEEHARPVGRPALVARREDVVARWGLDDATAT